MHIAVVFIFVVVAVVAALVFAVIAVLSLIFRAIGRLLMPRPGDPAPQAICPRAECRATNLASARFCRRCGQPLLVGIGRVNRVPRAPGRDAPDFSVLEPTARR